MVTGVGDDPSSDLCLDAFDRLISSHITRSIKGDPLKFFKIIEDVSEVSIPPKETIWVSLFLENQALIR